MNLRLLMGAAFVATSACAFGSAHAQVAAKGPLPPDCRGVASVGSAESGDFSDQIHFLRAQCGCEGGRFILRYLVLWRGEAGWYRHRDAAMKALADSGLIDTARAFARLARARTSSVELLGDITLEVRFDEARRSVWILDHEVALSEGNVILVDRVDRVGGPPTVQVTRIDAQLDSSAVAVSELIARSTVVRKFVR